MSVVFPPLRDPWILRESDDLLFVGKPPFVSCQAVDPQVPDDLPARIAAFRRSRGDSSDYVGTHQRLDALTSGVLVYAKTRGANRILAEAFESRAARKVYHALVERWRGGEALLENHLDEGRNGRMEVTRRGGKVARTRVKPVGKVGALTRLELVLETGRTHQARVQLAFAGSPIVGDPVYGGAPASRLMLHAASLTLPTEKMVVAPNDWMMELPYDEPEALRRRLEVAIDRRYGLSLSHSAFRLVNEEGDGLTRFALDYYAGYGVAQFYEDEVWTEARIGNVLDAVHACGLSGVYRKVRPKQANTVVDTRVDRFAPRAAVRGSDAPDPLMIEENRIPYEARLGDGLSTGIFLDQRANRKRIAEVSAGKSVLNLFSYVCAFTVAAAHGGARETVSVDAAPVALEWGRKQVLAVARAGGQPEASHQFVCDDVFRWMDQAARNARRFDVIVLDPPSFSKARNRVFTIQSDYPEIAAKALALLAPGGVLLACANHRKTSHVQFRKMLEKAVALSGRKANALKSLGDPSDYPTEPGRGSHLKSILVRLAD